MTKNLHHQVEIVAQYLGTGGPHKSEQQAGRSHVYRDENFVVTFTSNSSYDANVGGWISRHDDHTIAHGGDIVYERVRDTDKVEEKYTPGVWELDFEALLGRALREERRVQTTESATKG